MAHRVEVEIAWLVGLSEAGLSELKPFSPKARARLQEVVSNFSEADADRIKQIERVTNHDVKAVEYWLKEQVAGDAELELAGEFIHFACTSEDINNTSHALMLGRARDQVVVPQLQKVLTAVKHIAHTQAAQPMLARTHGQPATPTTLGKEFANVAARLQAAIASIEAVVPLAKDMVLAKTFDLNAAMRFTDYKLSGQVKTWKLGFTYKPVDDVLLRLTRSRDIRAPQLNGSGVGFDPFTNTNPRIITVTTGNPNLKPETADTLTYGVVYSPSWAPGLQGSVDYYNIDIQDAIGAISSANIINLCFQGATNLCPLITRVNGVITQTTSPQLNLARVVSRGLDIDATYGFNLSQFSDNMSGRVTLRLLGNHVLKLLTNNGVTAVDTAGEIGNSWRWTGSASYRNGPLTLSSTVRYVGAGALDNTYLPTDIQVNHVDAQYYVGLAGQYTIDRGDGNDIELFARVDNLLNRDPPIIPGAGQQPGDTNGGLYDVLGRNYAVGVRFKF